MLRIETLLLVISGGLWTLALGVVLGIVPLGGMAPLSLYRFFSLAAALGWISGNVYVVRRRRLEKRSAGDPVSAVGRSRGWLLMVYSLGPPSVLMLFWALAPEAFQQSAPLVPVYALAIFGLFFMIPLTLGGAPPSRRPVIGD